MIVTSRHEGSRSWLENSSCVALQNCWTINFLQREGVGWGRVGDWAGVGGEVEEGLCQCGEPLHMNHDRNQSINPPTRQPSGTALVQGTSRPPSWSQSQQGAGKMSHHFPIRWCLLPSAANRKENPKPREGKEQLGCNNRHRYLQVRGRRGLSHTRKHLFRATRQQTCFSGILASKADRGAAAVATA